MRENFPACLLFLILYAFGVSCGAASLLSAGAAHMEPLIRSFLQTGEWLAAPLMSCLYAFAYEIAWTAALLFFGMQPVTAPLWAICVMLRAFFSGFCARFCLSFSGAPNAYLLFIACFLPMLLRFPVELRLSIHAYGRLFSHTRARGRHEREPESDERYVKTGLCLAGILLLIAAFSAFAMPALLAVAKR